MKFFSLSHLQDCFGLDKFSLIGRKKGYPNTLSCDKSNNCKRQSCAQVNILNSVLSSEPIRSNWIYEFFIFLIDFYLVSPE